MPSSREVVFMFKFQKEQQVFDVGGVKIGGQPGQLPTVMVGSIFYSGHKLVKDEKRGDFDQGKAQALLKTEEELSDKTGNPCLIDVCCSWPDAFGHFIDFVADNMDGPFAIDGTTAQVKMAGARHVAEAGLANRVMYNSILPHTKEDEIAAIKAAHIKAAVLLALNTNNPSIAGRLEVVDSLLILAQKAGIEKPLVDATILDRPDPGPVSRAIYLIKEKYGLPAGAGAHNAVARWVEKAKLGATPRLLASSVANALPIAFGANFMLYGPVETAPTAYFYCSLTDAYVAYSVKQEFRQRPATPTHPLNRIFDAQWD
jgi:tetrahydromethanopterin S-methyltransferase subunit H